MNLQKWARAKKVESQRVFDETLRLVYTLVSNNLIELHIAEGEDGSETIVKSTTVGETYIESVKAKRP